MPYTIFGNRSIGGGAGSEGKGHFFSFAPRPAGGFFAAMSVNTDTQFVYQRYVRAFGSNGEPVAASVLLDTGEPSDANSSNGPIVVKELSGGRCVVAWVSQDGDNRLKFRVCDANGTAISAATVVNSPGFFTPVGGTGPQPIPDNFSKSFAIIQNGTGFAIIWLNSIYAAHVAAGITNSSSAFIRKYTVDGVDTTANIPINVIGATTPADVFPLDIAATSHSGGYAVVYSFYNQTTLFTAPFFTAFNNSDTPTSSLIDIDQNAQGYQIKDMSHNGSNYVIDVHDSVSGLGMYRRLVSDTGTLGSKTTYTGYPLPDNTRYFVYEDFIYGGGTVVSRFYSNNVLESETYDTSVKPSYQSFSFFEGRVVSAGLDPASVVEAGSGMQSFLGVISQYTPDIIASPPTSTFKSQIIWYS